MAWIALLEKSAIQFASRNTVLRIPLTPIGMRTAMRCKNKDGPKQIFTKIFRGANFGTGTI